METVQGSSLLGLGGREGGGGGRKRDPGQGSDSGVARGPGLRAYKRVADNRGRK